MAVSWVVCADLEIREQHAAVFLMDHFVLDHFRADREKTHVCFMQLSPPKYNFVFGYNLFPWVVVVSWIEDRIYQHHPEMIWSYSLVINTLHLCSSHCCQHSHSNSSEVLMIQFNRIIWLVLWRVTWGFTIQSAHISEMENGWPDTSPFSDSGAWQSPFNWAQIEDKQSRHKKYSERLRKLQQIMQFQWRNGLDDESATIRAENRKSTAD